MKKVPVAFLLSTLRHMMRWVGLGDLQRVSTDMKEPCVVGVEEDLYCRMHLEIVRNIIGTVVF